MASPLEKARQNPDSMKGKILKAARRIFGIYGFDGTTTRMIASEVGIDISTLYYHWGEKSDLYEALIEDIHDEIQVALNGIEKIVKGKNLTQRLDIAIERVADYLFANPEICNLIINHYFSKSKHQDRIHTKEPVYISNIAVAMGLAINKKAISPQAKAVVIAVWNSIFTLVTGEKIFRPMLAVSHKDYIQTIKNTMRFILLPAITEDSRQNPALKKK